MDDKEIEIDLAETASPMQGLDMGPAAMSG
jgi:hypothetical protein